MLFLSIFFLVFPANSSPYLPLFLFEKADKPNENWLDYIAYDLYYEKNMDDWILCLRHQNYCPGYQ